MPYPRLIPCLDVAGGIVVKGVRFASLREVGDPVALARRYSDQGADELVFLDVRATVAGERPLVDLIADVAAEVAIPITVGGGLRSLEDAAAFFSAGADKICLNTAAVVAPSLVTRLAERFGSQAVVVAIDALGGEVTTRAGTSPAGIGAVAWAARVEELGAGEILLTSMDADGTRAGYDIELTRAVAGAVRVPVIASGGAGSAAHVAEVLATAQAALVASIVHERPDGMRALRREVEGCGVRLRETPEARVA